MTERNTKKNMVVLPFLLVLITLVGLVVIPHSIGTSFATPAPTETTPTQDIVATQQISTQELTEDEKRVNGVTFTPRWSAPVEVEPGKLNILFADCLPNEFAVSSPYIFQNEKLITTQSFPIAWDDNRMSWITVVFNTDGSKTLVASNGVICASDNGSSDGTSSLDANTQITINNIVKQTIKIENNQIVNLNQVINIRQNITQNAYQIVNITGNNNTVTQIINQTASQIIASNGTNIGQSLNQTAEQIVGPGTLEQPQSNNTTTGTPDTGAGTDTTGTGNTTETTPTGTETSTTETTESTGAAPPETTAGEEGPTLPIDETSRQPVQEEAERVPEENTATPPETETEETTTTETEEETTTTEEPQSQIEEQAENPEEVVE